MSVPEGKRTKSKFVRLAKAGKITKKKVGQCYEAWKAHAKRGNTWKLLQRMDKFYAELWKEEDA